MYIKAQYLYLVTRKAQNTGYTPYTWGSVVEHLLKTV